MTRVSTPIEFLSDLSPSWGVVTCAYKCDHCNRLSVGTLEGDRGLIDALFSHSNMVQWMESATADRYLSWQPRAGLGKEFPNVPDHVADAASEAYECRSIGAYRGAALLARAVIEATAKAREITKGNLETKIDTLYNRGLIRGHVKEAAHEARLFGNDMAHGDFGEKADSDGADEVLIIMDEVLNDVFQSPARTELLRQRREAQKTLARGDAAAERQAIEAAPDQTNG
jgi:hypothetical protein